jgi:hypothetical protein
VVAATGSNDDAREATGTSASAVSFTVTVNASWALQP